MRQLRQNPVALTALATAIITFLLALEVMSAQVGAALTGLVTAALVAIRQVVTPVEKVAALMGNSIVQTNQLLVGVNTDELEVKKEEEKVLPPPNPGYDPTPPQK